MKVNKEKTNPIDIDKVAENPHLLPYAHHLGSAIIKPVDKGRVRGVAMSAMYQQTETQLLQIKSQVEHLINQAQGIHNRINISEKIYKSDMGFKPVLGQIYHLYDRQDGSSMLSMISPKEWGKTENIFLATVQLLSDHTWEILDGDLNKNDNV